jgi:hypothetical protein
MIDVDPLVEALGDSLAYSADDHSAVMWVESSVEHHFPQANRNEVRILTAAVTEALLATGLVHVGLPRGGVDFADEDVSPEQAARRVLDAGMQTLCRRRSDSGCERRSMDTLWPRVFSMIGSLQRRAIVRSRPPLVRDTESEADPGTAVSPHPSAPRSRC